jgi:protein phosphatase
MRICIISDLHANLEALSALPRDYDELWVLGDLVNYGPDPAETVSFVRAHASTVVRGNHDHAVGWFGADFKCSPRFRAMAEAMGRYTSALLGDADKEFLRKLPASARSQVDGRRFFLCHATPSDPLYEYRTADSPRWVEEEQAGAGADVILVGHTHLPFTRVCGGRLVANPGSLGQSKAGDPRARYAVWEDGRLELRAYDYPVEITAGKILRLALPEEVKRDLVQVLRTGRAP